MPVLTVTNLTKKYSSPWWKFKKKTYTAVNDISFELNKSEILGFLGPNGAGKTTTIQMLLGTLRQSTGSITYFGKNFETHRITCLQKIGYTSGYEKLPARLTVYENLDIIGRIYAIPSTKRKAQIKALLQSFGIWDLKDRPNSTLSAGQSTRVMLAKAFINDPEIVLLDEPTASLDPDVAQQVRQFILQQRKERGTSIIITSHNMNEVTELCDRVLVLKEGTIIADSTPDDLTQTIKKVHLHLTISHEIEKLDEYMKQTHTNYTREQNAFSIELDEHAVAPLLQKLAEDKIIYSQISIDKPTLEDYFISIASEKKIKEEII